MKSDKVVGRDYCIVDVRDDDWYGGNIKGSRNSPSHGFLSKVDELVAQTKDVPTIIFHCALSQVRYVRSAMHLVARYLCDLSRGPKAARVRSKFSFTPSVM